YEVGAAFWFVSGVRVSGAAGSRIAFDVEASRVDGASNAFVRLHRQYRARVRIVRPASDARVSKYWIAGAFALPADKRRGDLFVRKVFTGVTFGYGADARVGRHARIWNEVGVDGGDSIRAFATAGV